jgi:hypothetical protein
MLVAFLIVLNVLLFALVIPLALNVYRVRLHKRQRGLIRAWPVKQVALPEFDEIFISNELGPTLRTEVRFIGRGPLLVQGGTSDAEAWILAVLAKRASCMFEFGTCTGKTAYLWARNMLPEGKVGTITLAPEQTLNYAGATGDGEYIANVARRESVFTQFLYSGTDVEHKVVQYFGDSKAFDETPYLGKCDVVFVDGSHAYSYVMSDSEKALRMVKPGGIVLWHDYSKRRGSRDVFRALNELARKLPLVHLQGTTLVAYRKPANI